MLRTACRAAGVDLLDFPLPDKSPPRDRFLTRSEARALINACRSYHTRLAVYIALSTGCRIGAALALRWSQNVDFGRGVIDFHEPGRPITKKRRAVVPMRTALHEQMQDAALIARSDYVIEWRGKPVKSIKTAFNKATRRADLDWVTPHYLKHTAISWFAELGYSVDDIADFTETDPETVRRIYRKVNPDGLRGMASSLGSFLTTALSETSSETSKPAEDCQDLRTKPKG